MQATASTHLFDTHCHIDVADFDADRADVLRRSRENGVDRILVPAVDAAGWPALQALCAADDRLYPAYGLHPVYIDQHRMEQVSDLAHWIDRHRPAAVGEIGLDFFLPNLDRVRQQQLFEAQLSVARDAGLPVVLHVRKAHDQMLATLKRLRVPAGIVHAFNGSLQQASLYIGLGFKLGFGGTMTYDRANNIQRLVKALPLSAMVLETDAPDMAGSRHRGERNSPEYLPDYLQAMADLRDQDPAEIALQTTRNACEVFHLDCAA